MNKHQSREKPSYLRAISQNIPSKIPIYLFIIVLTLSSLIFPRFSLARSPLTPPPIEQSRAAGVEIAQSGDSPSSEASKQILEQGYPVKLDGRVLFFVKEPLGAVPAGERAESSQIRIQDFANNFIQSPSALQVNVLGSYRMIYEGNNQIIVLSPQEAQKAGLSINELSQKYVRIIQSAVSDYRQARQPALIIQGVIRTLIVILVCILLFIALNRLFKLMLDRLRVLQSHIQGIPVQHYQLFSSDNIIKAAIGVVLVLRWIIYFFILDIAVPLILSFFPWTRYVSDSVFQAMRGTLGSGFQSFVGYLPNLFIIAVIVFVTNVFLRWIRPIFTAIASERLTIEGFYPEWAQPSYKLTVFLAIALAAVIIFPYLPGSGSPAFQSISLFLGALLTLGSSTAISNVIAGYILIYTRAFQRGDLIKVGDVLGVVLEKSIFSTRLRLPNNVTVTLPNASLLSSNVNNYSASLREDDAPLILQTTITLGYDVPWRKVYETLVAAARATGDILENPVPIVWQTNLGDFSVSYEIRAYTNNSTQIGKIHSQLHENIQDKCNEAGIEILSPTYSALRDGNHSTMPLDYLAKDYQASGFRVDQIPLSSKDLTPKP